MLTNEDIRLYKIHCPHLLTMLTGLEIDEIELGDY